MEINETVTPPLKSSALEVFSERSFEIKLNGYQLLALYAVSQRIAGAGSARKVFSRYSDEGEDNSFCAKIGDIQGIDRALGEFEETIVDAYDNVIRLNNK